MTEMHAERIQNAWSLLAEAGVQATENAEDEAIQLVYEIFETIDDTPDTVIKSGSPLITREAKISNLLQRAENNTDSPFARDTADKNKKDRVLNVLCELKEYIEKLAEYTQDWANRTETACSIVLNKETRGIKLIGNYK